jgi:hypothetical protein
LAQIADEMKMESASIAFLTFKGKPLVHSMSVAQLANGDLIEVIVKSNVDRQRKSRGKCKSCICVSYSRPQKGNDCDYCKDPVLHHEEIQIPRYIYVKTLTGLTIALEVDSDDDDVEN